MRHGETLQFKKCLLKLKWFRRQESGAKQGKFKQDNLSGNNKNRVRKLVKESWFWGVQPQEVTARTSLMDP